MIRVRVYKITKISDRDYDEFVGWYSWSAVPAVGELVNLEGEPYFLIERGWASSGGSNKSELIGDTQLYCYLRVRA